MNRLCLILILLGPTAAAWAAEEKSTKAATPAQRGYRLLLEKPYLTPDFDQEVFDRLWTTWPKPLREKAAKATPEARRRMAFSRYGLTERPNDKSGKPLQYVVDKRGNWTMNCLACHGGKVAGRVIPGLPNSHYALETLTEETRRVKVRTGKPLVGKDVGILFMPLGTSNGTTNAVSFGVVLWAYRDGELKHYPGRPLPKMLHHDHDAPPWWHFKRRKKLYIDGFAPKNHRALMQFLLIRPNDRKKFDGWENDFKDIYAYLESIEPPKYPFPVDQKLAAEGETIFNRSCATCHGHYDDEPSYRERMIPIDVIGTDPLRHKALSDEHRRRYEKSWFAHFGRDKVIEHPRGYVAPPLDGIWASAPYFHNGAVPTLWHVLHPKKRPVVWRRSENGYDRKHVGLEVKTFGKLPKSVTTKPERRTYFDTRQPGKSASGHDFPAKLSEEERRAVLEYLKTL